MGGVVPLGYRVENRALRVVDDHAAIVRSLFRRYLEAGSVVRLKLSLDAEGLRIPFRIDGAGRSTGGGLFSRRHIYKLLSNPIYVGRIAHKGQVHEGQHPPIVDQDLWVRVQQSLRNHLGAARTEKTRQSSEALLAGKLFDDRGNRMSPTWARKGSKRGDGRLHSELCPNSRSRRSFFHFPVRRLAHDRLDLASPDPGGALCRYPCDRGRDGDADAPRQTIHAQSGSRGLLIRVLVLAVGRPRRDPFGANSSHNQDRVRSHPSAGCAWTHSLWVKTRARDFSGTVCQFLGSARREKRRPGQGGQRLRPATTPVWHANARKHTADEITNGFNAIDGSPHPSPGG